MIVNDNGLKSYSNKKNTFTDNYGRMISYLRVSVTDRCNLRCVYCMPAEGVLSKDHRRIMRYEEIAEVVRVAAKYGVNAVRLTGGEPLVRPNFSSLVKMIAKIPGIEDISMTSNAVLLEKHAQELADAGLNRVNISLDTLKPEKFTRISRLGKDFDQVWRGIKSAEQAGLNPIKINMVVIKGINDDEILEMARLSIENPWQIRFIELMPIQNQFSWGAGFPDAKAAYCSVKEIRDHLDPLGLEAVERNVGSGPAKIFRLKGAKGTVGLISPLGEHFCGTCNRLRLTSDGNLRPCLLSEKEVPVLDALRAGEDLLPYFQKALNIKPKEHELDLDHVPEDRSMAEIGG
ncbi:MAG: GTP 3',8-cyclase MoaA [Anaerolineaceae bacterium]|nr:GTP 3',8-cyclase MoaA [Anaerolineaceae bacterium]